MIALIAGGVIWYLSAKVSQPTVGQSFRTWAMFRDGSGLPRGSRVVIAGVQVGEIAQLGIEGGLAKVTMRLRNDVVIWNDSWAAKRASSLLGDSYIEILPGGPVEGGSPVIGQRRLRSGEPIPHVLEGTSTEKVLKGIENAMPRVDVAMNSANKFMHDARLYISGPLAEGARDVDKWLADEPVTEPMKRGAAGARDFKDWTERVASQTDDLGPRAVRTLDGFSSDLDRAHVAIGNAEVAVKEQLGAARARMDELDPYLERIDDTLAEYSGKKPPEQQGRLATLINDGELGESIENATAGVASYTEGWTRTISWMGLRAEYNVLAGQPRLYVIAELDMRNDKFYLIELEKGGLGAPPEITLTDQVGSNAWVQRATIKEAIRFTVQWGKKFGPARFRAGIKESHPGLGFDLLLGNHGRLKLSADIFEADFSQRTPRLKVGASLKLIEYIYILAGVDDVLNPGGYLPIAPWPPTNDVPVWFEEVHYGRDYYVGAMLQITDADLATMLRVYGAILLAGLAD